MREDIFEAALACDFQALESLAMAGAPEFNYSFGEPATGGTPGAYWQEAEERGETPLADMVKVLNLPGRTTGAGADQLYVWPFAQALDWQNLSEEDRTSLGVHFTESEIAEWAESGSYLGYRLGIKPDGDWLYFVAGD
jgi:hypothetical protein